MFGFCWDLIFIFFCFVVKKLLLEIILTSFAKKKIEKIGRKMKFKFGYNFVLLLKKKISSIYCEK